MIDLGGQFEPEGWLVAEDVKNFLIDPFGVLDGDSRGDAGDADVRGVLNQRAQEVIDAVWDKQNVAPGDQDFAKIVALGRTPTVSGNLVEVMLGEVVPRIVGPDAVAAVGGAGERRLDDQRSAIKPLVALNRVPVAGGADGGLLVPEVGLTGFGVFVFGADVLAGQCPIAWCIVTEAQPQVREFVAQEGGGQFAEQAF